HEVYAVGKGEFCGCKDHPKAVKGLCKHILSYHIFTRGRALAREKLAALDAEASKTEPLPTAQPALTVSPVTHSEAPASVNCYVSIGGRQVQLTLRDQDEQRLLLRLETLLQRFPVVEEPKEHAQKEGWCYKHNVQMKLNHGKRGSWWSHKLPNGQWCNQK